MNAENILSEMLRYPPHAIAYEAGRIVAAAYPGRDIVEVNGCAFAIERYAGHGNCQMTSAGSAHNRYITHWDRSYGVYRTISMGVCDVVWDGHEFVVVMLTWPNAMHGESQIHWIIGPSRSLCESLFAEVSVWSRIVSGEVLVFMDGSWQRNTELLESIESSSFDNLVLPAALSHELRQDIGNFLKSREIYERYNIPWKRGILFLGPPGNGKTHAVKALINETGIPCLYVKSFKSEYGNDHGNIRRVFDRARETTPCLLVLEDLDSLLNDNNRSFFLNEMDGFEANTGVIVLATTNHPERLDPAIIDRPSRFDRKYHFSLPAMQERLRYLEAWNISVDPDLRVAAEALVTIAESTDGFSFAYLKELCLSAMMQWIGDPRAGAIAGVMLSQADNLRSQMASEAARASQSAPLLGDEEEEEE